MAAVKIQRLRRLQTSEEIDELNRMLRDIGAAVNGYLNPSGEADDNPPGLPPIGLEHGVLSELVDDDHLQYLHLPGRSGGQVGQGGINPSEILRLGSTANAIKGNIIFHADSDVVIQENNKRVGIKASIPLASLHVKGEPPSTIFWRPSASVAGVGFVAVNGVFPGVIAETVVDDDGTYIVTTAANPSQDTRFNLNGDPVSTTDFPASPTGWIFRFTHRKVNAAAVTFDWYLLNQSGATVASGIGETAATAYAQIVVNLTPAQITSLLGVGNESCNLLVNNFSGLGAFSATNQWRLTQAELEVPSIGSGGVGGKTIIAQAAALQIETLFEAQSLAGVPLVDITAAGRLTIESGGSVRVVPLAGANRLWTSDANGDMSLVAVGGDLSLAAGIWTILNDAVTYAKMQNVSAADRLLGRGNGGGAGDVQEIILGTNLSMVGTTLNAAGSSGAAITEPFVTIGNTAGLSAERALAVGAALSLVDGGANASVTLDRAALTGDVTAPAGSNVTTIAAGVVTASMIANRTRQIYLPIHGFAQSNGTAAALTFTGTYPNRYRYIPFVTAPAAAPQAWQTSFQVPEDYVSDGKLIIYWYAITLNDAGVVMAMQYLARLQPPEDDTTTAQQITGTHTLVTKDMTDMRLTTLDTPRAPRDINYLCRTDIGALTVGVVPLAFVNLHILRNSAHASDTYTGDLRLLGAAFSYTADS